MSRDTIANVIARVNKLRELAKGTTNEHEAAAATGQAARLIDKHQLSEMDLQVKGEKDAEPISVLNDPLYKTGRAMAWISKLAVVLCEHYGCTGYWDHVVDPMTIANKNPKAVRDSYKAFKMVGRTSDAEVIRYMFDWLQPVIVDLMKVNASGRGMRYSQNYALGVVDGIDRQLKLEHERAHAEAARNNTSQAMILLDNRLVMSKDHMENNVKGLYQKYSNLKNDSDAKARGIRAGESISLNKGLNTSNSPKRLS